MATYQGIKGRTVQNLASDPPAALGAGQVWFNTTSNTLKTTVGVAAWASGGNTVDANMNNGAAGILTAALRIGGYTGPTGNQSVCSEYDGTTWTEVNNIIGGGNSGLRSGIGTQTAAFAAAGNGSSNSAVEEYDGTCWTANAASLNTGRTAAYNGGITSAAWICGGAPGNKTESEEFDGTSWAASPGSLNEGREDGAGLGTQTAALIVCGHDAPPPFTDYVEEFNGSTWSVANVYPLSLTANVGNIGTQTAGMVTTGTSAWPPVPYATQLKSQTTNYDGTSWATTASTTYARKYACGGGTNTAAWVACGVIPTTFPATAGSNVCEEFTVADTVQTITAT
jgi:hypothetical protein